MPYLNEATLALQEGHTPAREIDEALVAFGMPMGPFTLMDMLGLDVCVHVGEYLRQSVRRPNGGGRPVTQAGAGRPARRKERRRLLRLWRRV